MVERKEWRMGYVDIQELRNTRDVVKESGEPDYFYYVEFLAPRE